MPNIDDPINAAADSARRDGRSRQQKLRNAEANAKAERVTTAKTKRKNKQKGVH